MKKNRLSWVLAFLMLVSFPVFSQNDYNPEDFSEAETTAETEAVTESYNANSGFCG